MFVKSSDIKEAQLEFRPGARSILSRKSYFAIPLNRRDPGSDGVKPYSDALKDLSEYLERNPQPITDVFVISHGWHRNLCRGIATYDRLFHRLLTLRSRGVLKHPNPDFNPLYLCLHWHSDFGQDGWIDLEGRRKRDEFLSKGLEIFEPNEIPEEEMLTRLEAFYRFATVTTAPDVDPLDSVLRDQGENEFGDEYLAGLKLRFVDDATSEQKAIALWTCFFETPTQVVTDEQREEAEPRQGQLQAVFNLFSFLFKVLLPVSIVAGLLQSETLKYLKEVGGEVEEMFGANGKLKGLLGIWDTRFGSHYASAAYWIFLGGAIYLLAIAVLLGSCQRNLRERQNYLCAKTRYDEKILEWRANPRGSAPEPPVRPQPRPLSPIKIGLYLWVQVLNTIPLVLGALASYLTLRWIPILGLIAIGWEFLKGKFVLSNPDTWSKFLLPFKAHLGMFASWVVLYFAFRQVSDGLFDERFGKRGKAPRAKKGLSVLSPRVLATRLASWPAKLAEMADSPSSRIYHLWDTVRSQLTIVKMQMRAVESASSAEEFLSELVADRPSLKGVDLHLIGHSYGGLLMVNLAKNIAHRLEGKFQLRSLITIQGAYASDWFSGETKLMDEVKGVIASMYTKYDTATGAIYSAEMAARFGAGSVGLCYLENRRKKETAFRPIFRPLPSATLSEPPDLLARIRAVEGEDFQLPERVTLNIDGSRFMFDGPPATGGAHDDIFKSEVIHTLWALTTFGRGSQ